MEDSFVIKGGKPLKGEVRLSGAKNVALKTMIAALMFQGKVILENIPRINDVLELMHLITTIGGTAEFIDKNKVLINGDKIHTSKLDFLHASKIRTSFMLFAPLLYKFNQAYIPNPGGCRIGARPIDRIVDGMKHLGIDVEYDSNTGYYLARMPHPPKGSYSFFKPTHTGTELLILIALFSKEKVVIENAAQEPEIDDLINFLNESGAKIKRKFSAIIIEGVSHLKQTHPYTIISDRNEAITYATLAYVTKGEITISGINQPLIEKFLNKLKDAGGSYEIITKGMIRFTYNYPLRAVNVQTYPHPGFMTDWQPNWAVLMTQAQGDSIIYERVFEDRFRYVDELRKFGAIINFIPIPDINPLEYFFFNADPRKKYNQAIRIEGPQRLHSGVVNVTDLRAGATLAIAALAAPGESVINGASMLERGYEDFVQKIKGIGGDIRKH